MADIYSGATAEDGDRGSGGFIDDTSLKWFGVGLPSPFALTVLALVAYIVAAQADFALMRTILPQFVDTYLLVLQTVVIGGILPVTAGVFVGPACVSKTAITSGIATAYVQFSRGTPFLFQIFVIYSDIPTPWPGAPLVQNWGFPTVIIALTLNHAVYVGEAVCGGIGAAPDGQMEVTRSFGMGYIQEMCETVIPQARRNVLAAIGNNQVIFVKDTSLLTIIAIPELMQAFRSVDSMTFDPWMPLVLVVIAHLPIILPLMRLATCLEERSDWGGDRR